MVDSPWTIEFINKLVCYIIQANSFTVRQYLNFMAHGA